MHRPLRVPSIVCSVIALQAASVSAQDLSCTTPLGDVEVRGNLNITARCELVGTEVAGNVVLFSGGSLIARDIVVRGNLEADRAYGVDLERSLVQGDIELEDLVGDESRIEETVIEGDVMLSGNRSALEVLNNDVAGTTQAIANLGGVTISGNSFQAGLNCSDNTPPPDGTGNVVGDNEQEDEDEADEDEASDQEEESREDKESDSDKEGKGKKDKKEKKDGKDAGQCVDLPPEPTITPAPPPAVPVPATPSTPLPSTPAPPAPAPAPTAALPSAATPVVSIQPADVTPPTLTLRGASSVTLTVGSAYTDEGATAMDAIDGDLTSRVSVVNPVNTNLLGTFTITYFVSDSAGNAAAPVTRTVTIEPQAAEGGGGGGGAGIEFAAVLLLLAIWRAESHMRSRRSMRRFDVRLNRRACSRGLK